MSIRRWTYIFAVLALCLGVSSRASAQQLTYDIRLGDGGNTKARTVSVGDVLTLEVYAIVAGTDSLDNEGFQFGWGSILSTRSGNSVGGNLSTATLSSSFSAPGSQAGSALDLNGDGFLDVGSNGTTQNSDFIQARASSIRTNGTRVGSNSEEFLLGTVTYTVTAAGDGNSTGVNFRITNFTNVAERNSLFQVDGATKTDLNGTIGTGVSVLLSAGPATAYWRGSQGSSWATDNLGATNFATNSSGTTDTGVLPGSATDLFFNSTNAANFGNTTLDRDFGIKSLTFTSNATGPVQIASGMGAPHTLTLGLGGLTVQSGSGAHTISANVGLGAAQVWSVGNSAANPFTVSGNISGASPNSLTKTGTGTLVLSGNNSFLGDTVISGGTLVAASTNALGGTSNISVSSGASLALSGAGNLARVNTSATLRLDGGKLVRLQGASQGLAPNGGTGGAVGFGTLKLTAASSIDFGNFGSDVGTLVFANFDPQAFVLTIDNWTSPEIASNPQNYAPSSLTDDRLIFHADQTANLALFNFTGYTGARQIALGNGYFEIVPTGGFTAVPEASTVFVCLALLGLVAWRQRGTLRALGQWVFTSSD